MIRLVCLFFSHLMVSETRIVISVNLLWYPDGPLTSGSIYMAGLDDGDDYMCMPLYT